MEAEMNIQDIEYMWKVASNDPNHDFNWHDPVVIRFAELVAQHQREKDRQQAIALLRQLHDSFSLESAELRIHQWASKEKL